MGRGWARRLRALLAVGIVVSSEAGAEASDDEGQGHVRAVRLLLVLAGQWSSLARDRSPALTANCDPSVDEKTGLHRK